MVKMQKATPKRMLLNILKDQSIQSKENVKQKN